MKAVVFSLDGVLVDKQNTQDILPGAIDLLRVLLADKKIALYFLIEKGGASRVSAFIALLAEQGIQLKSTQFIVITGQSQTEKMQHVLNIQTQGRFSAADMCFVGADAALAGMVASKINGIQIKLADEKCDSYDMAVRRLALDDFYQQIKSSLIQPSWMTSFVSFFGASSAAEAAAPAAVSTAVTLASVRHATRETVDEQINKKLKKLDETIPFYKDCSCDNEETSRKISQLLTELETQIPPIKRQLEICAQFSLSEQMKTKQVILNNLCRCEMVLEEVGRIILADIESVLQRGEEIERLVESAERLASRRGAFVDTSQQSASSSRGNLFGRWFGGAQQPPASQASNSSSAPTKKSP